MSVIATCTKNKLKIFFFNDTATTEIYTLSLHDALPISLYTRPGCHLCEEAKTVIAPLLRERSEEHTSELQSQSNLVCRLLLEKKNDPKPSILADPAPGINPEPDVSAVQPQAHRLVRLLL